MEQGPIPTLSPLTPAPTHMLYTLPRHLCLSHFRSRFPTFIQCRVVHGHFPPSRIKLCITRTMHRVGGPHTSWEDPSWEVFHLRCGCITECVSLIPFSPSEWRGADDIFLVVVCFWQVAPTKRSQPLLKRLFTSFGPWGSSSSGPSPKSKHPPTRRHLRRRSF